MLKFFFLICTFSCLTIYAEVKPLKIGMELTYPPFETINTQGEPTGFSVDLSRALASYLKRPLEIVNLPFIGLIASLKTHKIDLVISSLTMTEKRKNAIAFSDPYLEGGLSLLLNKNSQINSIEEADQAGNILVVKQGTTGHTWAVNHLKKAKLLVLDKESSAVLEVVQGKADAFIYDPFSIRKNWERNKSTTSQLKKPFYQEYWAIGLRKDDIQLREEVNAFLKEFKNKGDFDKLFKKYFPQDHPS